MRKFTSSKLDTRSGNTVLSLAVSLALAVGASVASAQAIDDAMLTTKSKAALIADPATKAYQIDVESENGVVQLNGFVDTAAARMAAVGAIRKLEGVKQIDNNLQIRGMERSASEVVNDTALSAKVKAALLGDSRTDGMDIEVDVYRGVVSLGGFVESDMEMKAAAEVAKTVSGVTKVENGVKVGKPMPANKDNY